MDEQLVNQKVKEVLLNARTLIALGWTQRTYAADAAGNGCSIHSPKATRFCPLGALRRCSWNIDSEVFYAAHGKLSFVLGGRDTVHWNDDPHRTQEEVVAAFDKAINRLS